MVASDEADVDLRSATTFAHAFREATDQRGLSLERITYHLRRRGHDLSTATLSYWRTGRSVPQRSTSIAALGALEEILGVERGSLASLVPPRPTRLTGDGRNLVQAERFIKRAEVISQLMSELGLNWDMGMEYLSVHDHMRIRRDGTLEGHLVTALMRATREGVDRLPTWYGHDDPGAYPFISAENNCRIGQVVESKDLPLVVAELLLPRPMNVGEVVHIQYTNGAGGQTEPFLDWSRGTVGTVRESYLEVEFDPQAIPVKAEEFVEIGQDRRTTPLPVIDHTLRRYRRDFGPGVWGLAWEWSPGTLAPIRNRP
ncbi:hypothetical protein KILIM_025_00460 [Kineosphaera limosa NBRC 100340]|uniref:Uncharacterized protein n=1 Tax=Kineosphaera limosa NBRC 100340 TaxID=1184609 RepID=K6XA55_9MICO|nr:hypothetical protein KILIM_025_00460 [Kineosphaera limosa NBRC 100340]